MSIRTLFSTRRPIDRPIEKVIDYYATDEKRLLAEVEEYEVTDNVERCFRKFLDTFGEGVRSGQVSEIGVWVAGFYGSGKILHKIPWLQLRPWPPRRPQAFSRSFVRTAGIG